MKGKILVVLLLLVLVITSSTIAATKPVFKEQAAGFRYKVTLEDPTPRWEIGYKDQTCIIIVNEPNIDYLRKYKNNVDELNLQIIKLIIWTVCLISIFVFAYLIKKKMKFKTSILALLIFANGTVACINIIPAAFEIKSSYKEATKYYQILAK